LITKRDVLNTERDVYYRFGMEREIKEIVHEMN